MADCHGFYQVTTRAYRQAGGDACISTIREVWSLIDDIVAKRKSQVNCMAVVGLF